LDTFKFLIFIFENFQREIIMNVFKVLSLHQIILNRAKGLPRPKSLDEGSIKQFRIGTSHVEHLWKQIGSKRVKKIIMEIDFNRKHII